jgi:hypothetical protein
MASMTAHHTARASGCQPLRTCAITLAVLGFNLFGDGLRDILDTRLAGEG